MNIQELSGNIWKSDVLKESQAWAGKFGNGIEKLFSIVNNDLINCSNTSLQNSLIYNFCIKELEKYLKNNELNLALSQKYLMYLIENKDDIIIEKIPSYFYKILICYFVKSRGANLKFSNNALELIVYFISKIDEMWNNSKANYNKALLELSDAFIKIFALTDYGDLSDEAFNFECKLFDLFFDLMYKLSNENGLVCKINLFKMFLNNKKACPFYFNKSDNLNIKARYEVKTSDENFISYNEHLFRYAMAMKHKKYYLEQTEKFKNVRDVLNSVLWSNKYYKDDIKTCISMFFKKNGH